MFKLARLEVTLGELVDLFAETYYNYVNNEIK